MTIFRVPDDDLIAAFQSNRVEFDIHEIYNVLAEVPGHNDESHWFWLVEVVKNNEPVQTKKIYLLDGWCDYTGWDCQSGLTAFLIEHQTKPEGFSRQIWWQLMDQTSGKQPFGLEIGERE